MSQRFLKYETENPNLPVDENGVLVDKTKELVFDIKVMYNDGENKTLTEGYDCIANSDNKAFNYYTDKNVDFMLYKDNKYTFEVELTYEKYSWDYVTRFGSNGAVYMEPLSHSESTPEMNIAIPDGVWFTGDRNSCNTVHVSIDSNTKKNKLLVQSAYEAIKRCKIYRVKK